MPYGDQSSQLVARLLTEYQLIRAQDNLIRCPIYDGADLAAPDADGTVSVYRDSDTDDGGPSIVNAQTITVTSQVATYTVLAASLPTSIDFADSWRVVWKLTIGTDEITVRQTASLVRYVLFPVVTDQDLYRRARALNPSTATPITTRTTFQDERDETWAMIYNRVSNQGNRCNLIMEPSALRESHLTRTLAMIYRNLSTREDDAYDRRAEEYMEDYKVAWRDLKFKYDTTESGTAAEGERSVNPSVWLTSRW